MRFAPGGGHSIPAPKSPRALPIALPDLVAAGQRLGPALGTIVLPFALVLYLALQGGGYDTIIRSEVGLVVWWIVLLGALVGILPVNRFGRAAWAGLLLLAAFTAWTALGIGWSESSERSVTEAARVATYLGVFALALATQGRDGLRRTVSAVAAAIGVVGAIALLSRLHPAWFPADHPVQFLPGTRGRLNYPLSYWNGMAALMAIGIPLLLVVATHSRRLVSQALAAAAVPVLALAAFYTFSRGGVLEISIAMLGLVLLHPRRLALLPTLGLGAAGSTLVIAAASQRDALEDGLKSTIAEHQGDQMLAFVLVVCVGVALARVALGLAARHGIGPRISVSRRATAGGMGVIALVAVVAALAAGLPSELSDRWDEFKNPNPASGTAERFSSANGAGRYQQWQAAIEAWESEPVTGIGPGTYEFWWSREGSLPTFVRDAHSLYLETLAELGIVGLVLVAGLILGVLGVGISKAVSGATEHRGYLAGALAAIVAFAVAAGVDWAWELTVIPIAFLLLAAAVLRSASNWTATREPSSGWRRHIGTRLPLAGLAVPCLVLVMIVLASTSTLRRSQAEFREAQIPSALGSARAAEKVQPYAASASLQEALVLELRGDLESAAAAARQATEQESTNWRTWLILSRIEAERGHAQEAVGAYREARSLNPRSPLFAGSETATVTQ
jgi:hypothetical protein